MGPARTRCQSSGSMNVDHANAAGTPIQSLWLIGVCTLVLWSGTVMAQTNSIANEYPNRPIKIVVPFPAGGGTDILARLVGQKMSEDWGQPVIIENRPGANTAIGAQLVARSTPDGYTLLAAMDVTMVMNSASGVSMSYDPVKDFAPVDAAGEEWRLARCARRRRRPDNPSVDREWQGQSRKLTYGAGVPITRLAGFMFVKSAGFEALMVPYKGSAEALQGLLFGSVDFVVDGIATMLPLVTSGKLRALARLDARPHHHAARPAHYWRSRRIYHNSRTLRLGLRWSLQPERHKPSSKSFRKRSFELIRIRRSVDA